MERAGERIQGSKFVRDFCARCGEPIRVATIFDEKVPDRRIENYCNDCDPRPPDEVYEYLFTSFTKITPFGYSNEPISEIRYNG